MTSIKLNLIIVLAVVGVITSCKQTPCPVIEPCPPANAACNDSCNWCIANDYSQGDYDHDTVYEIASADVRIDTLRVTHLTTSNNYMAEVFVSNHGDDDAQNTMLVILLPTDVTVNDVNMGSHALDFKRCGAALKVCLGNLGTDYSLEVNRRMVTVTTTACKLVNKRNMRETFSATVYSTVPDPCPINNYKYWNNDSVTCDMHQFTGTFREINQ